MSCWPDMTSAAAKFTASRPEAQNRLICTPGTWSPKPANSAAARAMSPPASPTGSTQPITTSSTSSASSLLRSLMAASACAARLSAVTSCSAPSGLAAAARRANVVVDECVGHWTSPHKLLAISSFMISLVPRIDAHDARVAIQARDRVFVHIAIAAEQLQAAVDHICLRCR